MTEQELADLAIFIGQRLFEIETFYWRVNPLYEPGLADCLTVTCNDYSQKSIIELWHVAKLTCEMIHHRIKSNVTFEVMEFQILFMMEESKDD